MKNMKYGIKNEKNKTPRELFSVQHDGLAKEAEKWMKETAQACMIVTTLIATVMLAAAFTLPGGSDQNTGRPLRATTTPFKIFIISDAVSLFSSCTSVLMFFAILTSRYAEMDFLTSLPKKMILGLSTLFISIATMMATFAATLVIVLPGEASWVYIPVSV
ncbi:ankyrin repeat-containing protein NPR4-like [Papaver somniferum]|uniref:ankyrin repeat-containing protein NPR4-like n=1 Tax=Papaver somniferum TaxID=3469 RepID=UPI000E6FCEA8|nr:ankyrin repeat-containing protein NPR4-like [Papaver somniferum]